MQSYNCLCENYTGYTYNVIAFKIEHIHASYGLNGKVIGTITGNGSNFVKAFSVYSMLTKVPRVQKGEANQKQQLFDYTCN